MRSIASWSSVVIETRNAETQTRRRKEAVVALLVKEMA